MPSHPDPDDLITISFDEPHPDRVRELELLLENRDTLVAYHRRRNDWLKGRVAELEARTEADSERIYKAERRAKLAEREVTRLRHLQKHPSFLVTLDANPSDELFAERAKAIQLSILSGYGVRGRMKVTHD